ncbi:hypothetical protein QNO08_04730 [Arthrobacter sp. zg-Y820]|uniref:lipopolysaccharide biosynthesis protein n=1 Tax=unclassified Arthrobacter TaxID=235627 RepID=UPI001E50503D|nr:MULTISPECIES: hypothetical protein [unclassified Arthrobacter]MCC9198017.1 hypothetical protein [Arthrobacter sp. zg-Y820]MDK1280884.1 hypothetical protein [Arthrobacter sp. zg.Y820]WIB10362.1 hypothetical protein QNO08_04730 [Arthrobacter sp. zg-Y820]
MRLNSVFTRGIGVLIVRVSGAALQLVLVALAVALFPIGDVGQNAILWSAAVIARVGGTLGLDLYILRELPSLWDKSQPEFGLRCKSIVLSLVKILLPLILVALSGGLWLAHFEKLERDLAIALPVVLLASAVQRLWSCQLRARGQLMLGQTLDAIALPLLAIVFLLTTWAWAPHLFIVGQCTSIVMISIVMFFILRRDWRHPGKLRTLTSKEWKDVAPLGVGSGLSVLASRAPIMFVGASSISQAASFEIGQRVHSAATLASASATAVLFPRVKGLIDRGQTKQLLRELASSAVLGLIPALLILAGLLVIGADRADSLLGNEYSGAWATAVILSIAACINAITGLCHGVLAMANSTRSFWMIAATQAAITFVYGIFFFDGQAEHMAIFVLSAELARGIVLAIITSRLFRTTAQVSPKILEEVV